MRRLLWCWGGRRLPNRRLFSSSFFQQPPDQASAETWADWLLLPPLPPLPAGRHLLQELLEDRFVPNDTRMGDGSSSSSSGHHQPGRVHVLTGPNCSGKSVYLKQAALVVLLAHVGSFVPADRAVVGLTDRIFTRLNANDSVTAAVQQSAFMRDLSQLAAMLRHATPRSLLVVDEFGKGTLAADGVGLLCAALGELAGRRPAPPRALVSTHFTEALDPELLPRNPQIEFFTMCGSAGLSVMCLVMMLPPVA